MSTVDLLEEIQTLVCDRLQVVSYKWLSRNYALQSDDAKRLLQEYVGKYGQGSKVIYALSGWLKSDPPSYKIQLVSGTNLEESKNVFKGNCSIQVYSVQASLPKDSATLWNTDFIQSEELYKQPATAINCLRDNRFGGIYNQSIQRTVDGISVSISKDVCNSNVIPKTVTSFSQQSKVPEARVEISAQPSELAKNAKTATKSAGTHERPAEKERFPRLSFNKKKAQSDAAITPGKLNYASPTEETKSSIPQSDAQVKANKSSEFGGSDDEGEQVNVKRSSQKLRSHRRRVMLDSSDEDENEAAVNLSSPDVPKDTSRLDQIHSIKTSNATELKIDAVNDKQRRPMLYQAKKNENKESDVQNVSEASLENTNIQVPDNIMKRKVSPSNPAPAPPSPKRKKVLKTHIDERGREVTEVIWEGGDEKKSAETSTAKKTDGSKDQSTLNRPIGQNKKSPAVGSSGPPNPSGKAGNKKTGNPKDPKQGNIMSFFKRV